MTARSESNGRDIFYDSPFKVWRYSDTKKIVINYEFESIYLSKHNGKIVYIQKSKCGNIWFSDEHYGTLFKLKHWNSVKPNYYFIGFERTEVE